MDKQKLDHFKRRLSEEKDSINSILRGLDEKGLDRSLRDDTSELSSYDNHPADIASETFEAEKNRALRANEVTHLKMVEDAMERIEKGNYGVCRECGREISEDRLEVVPFTDLCIDCEEKERFNTRSFAQDRPIEETVLGYPFGSINKDPDDYTGYDGEDTWQELESFNSPNYLLWDEEDDTMQGVVENTDRISNEQYKRQLPD